MLKLPVLVLHMRAQLSNPLTIDVVNKLVDEVTDKVASQLEAITGPIITGRSISRRPGYARNGSRRFTVHFQLLVTFKI